MEGRFHNGFEDKPAKWLIAKKKPPHQNIHPELIHLSLEDIKVIKDVL